jgi:hypothetical protein
MERGGDPKGGVCLAVRPSKTVRRTQLPFSRIRIAAGIIPSFTFARSCGILDLQQFSTIYFKKQEDHNETKKTNVDFEQKHRCQSRT